MEDLTPASRLGTLIHPTYPPPPPPLSPRHFVNSHKWQGRLLKCVKPLTEKIIGFRITVKINPFVLTIELGY